MKKIFYIINILFCFMVLAGCDDMLDVTPGSELTDDGFWKSATDLEGACNRLYYDFKWWTDANNSLVYSTASDEMVAATSNSISNGSRSTPGSSTTDWSYIYDYIYVANNIIAKGSEAPLEESVRNRWIAEAYFFRAYHHFDLVKRYGDVPMVTKIFTSLDDPDIKMPRTPRETVIQQCYQDLEFAATYLPKHSALPTTELGRRRVSRSSALAMMVRIGLYEGTFQKYHKINNGANANAHLDKAISAFELLEAENYHSLFSDFNMVFSYTNEANDANREIIFGKAYGENDYSTVSVGHTNVRNMEGSYALTRNVLDLFLYADGLPMDKTLLKVASENSYNNIVGLDVNGNELPNGMGQRDPRLLKSIWTINDALEYNTTVGWAVTGKGKFYPFDSQRPMGYPCKKGFFGSMWEQSIGNKDYTDKIIIRYAEMLISYAEALYERNGSITDAQLNATVNKLRERVGFNVKLTNAFVSQNGLDMLEEIRRERTVELMAEGFRYFDILRWKTAEKVLPVALLGPICLQDELQNPSAYSNLAPRVADANGMVNGVFVHEQPGTYVLEYANSRVFDPEKDYLFPIPSEEIVLSGDNVVQNPKW